MMREMMREMVENPNMINHVSAMACSHFDTRNCALFNSKYNAIPCPSSLLTSSFLPFSSLQMAAMNPQLGAALQNPQIRSMLSDPNFLRQMSDPAVLQVCLTLVTF